MKSTKSINNKNPLRFKKIKKKQKIKKKNMKEFWKKKCTQFILFRQILKKLKQKLKKKQNKTIFQYLKPKQKKVKKILIK